MSACSYHSETEDPVEAISYNSNVTRKASSVGKLRRLAFLPVEVIAYKGRYQTSNDLLSAAKAYERQCLDYLTHVKGYDIVFISESDPEWANAILEKNGFKNLKKLFDSFPKSVSEKQGSTIIQVIGRNLGADGVLVVRLKEEKPWTWHGILNIALMNLPLIYQLSSPDIGAWVYETASGRLVWKQEEAVFGAGDKVMPFDVQWLFKEMENAIPVQMLD